MNPHSAGNRKSGSGRPQTSGRRVTRRSRSAAASDRNSRRAVGRRRQRPAHRRVQESHGRAQVALRGFRQATILAVAITTLLMMLWGMRTSGAQQPAAPADDAASANAAAEPDAVPADADDDSADSLNDAGARNESDAADEPAESEVPAADAADSAPADEPEPAPVDPQRSFHEATSTVRQLASGFVDLVPKIAVALFLLILAWAVSAALRRVLHRLLSGWEKSEAITAMVRIALLVLAIGAGLSVIAGDATALIGSVGLTGLALSWALQTPIESFTGWVLNAMRGYYRRGDRIEVGSVFGDVYRIDILTTTVWEAGGLDKAVTGAQPTGAIITFPNWEILRSNIINYSRDFPYVWDEVTFAVANESDLRYTVDIFRKTSYAAVGEMMREPAEHYRKLLDRNQLAVDVEQEPQIYLSLAEAWTNCTVRYLVPLRERRRWSSVLILALSVELAKPEHQKRIIGGYPRTEVGLRRATKLPSAEEQPASGNSGHATDNRHPG